MEVASADVLFVVTAVEAVSYVVTEETDVAIELFDAEILVHLIDEDV